MSLVTILTNKLVRAPLICLAIVLAIGSFLWQSSLYQKMLDQVDAELYLAARTVDYLHHTRTSDPIDTDLFCATASALLEHSASTLLAAFYSRSGTLVCRTTDAQIPGAQLPSSDVNSDDTFFYFTSADGTTLRSVLLPLNNIDTPVAFVTLSADFSPFSSKLLRLRLALLLASVLILAAAALYLRHPRRQQHCESFSRLAVLMDQADPDQHPLLFPVDSLQSSELRQLAERYNQMVERMHAGVHRARQFAAHVAHELRTPLTILRGETEIALRCNRDAKDIRQVLESNLEEITRMSYLVDDLLTLSKSDLGEIPLQPKAILLPELLSDLQRQARILGKEKDITVEAHCDDSHFVIHADELRLRQALLNLLTNAIRYTPTKGKVSIDALTQETQVTITISDNGIGIDEKHLQHIFERFYRVDKKAHQYDGGTGLGLAIVKWVVDAHQGTIEVSSTPGQGSCFAIHLPTKQPKQL